MDIKNSVALVTGANRGLGSALVRTLLESGAKKVYAAARDPASIARTGATPLRLDVTDEAQIEALRRECGDVNLLINNAGIARGTSLLSAEGPAAAQAELQTNFFGPWLLSRAFAPILAANGGGAIVNVLSVLSWLSIPSVATYCASKSAAWSLTNGLRTELKSQGTLVVGVHVGYMDTDMASHVSGPKSDPIDVANQILAALANGREEVLADALSKDVKRGLSADPGVYLGQTPR
ncbi:MAG: SDR family oxidoreductase [Burkholderiaceae bacterium]